MTALALHIVNGTSAIQTLQNSGIRGEFIEWLDVLHDGPLGPTENRQEFLELRANFIHDCGWEKHNIALKRLQIRDEMFLNWVGDIYIWNSFEMFDQLQLLDMINISKRSDLNFIFLENYLSHPGDAEALLATATNQSSKDMDQLKDIWSSVCTKDKAKIAAHLSDDLSQWPFLKTGLERFILELPDDDGLNQTDRYILEELSKGNHTFGELFRAVQSREAIRFMGDASFYLRLQHLAEGSTPRIIIENDSEPSTSQFRLNPQS